MALFYLHVAKQSTAFRLCSATTEALIDKEASKLTDDLEAAVATGSEENSIQLARYLSFHLRRSLRLPSSTIGEFSSFEEMSVSRRFVMQPCRLHFMFFFHICILAHSLNRVCLDCSDDSEICNESPNKHDGDEDVVQVDFISVARHKQPGEHRSMQFKLNVLKIAAYLSMMFGFAHVDLYVQLLQEPAPLAVMSRMASLISLVKF